MEGWDEQFSHWRHEVQIGTSSSGCDQFLTQPNFPSHCISPSSTACLWLCLCLWLFVCVCACLSVTSEAVTDDKRLRARLATRNWQEDTYSTLPMAKRRQILQIFSKYFSDKVVEIQMYQKWHFEYAPLWQNQIDRVKCAEYFAQLTHRIYKPGNFPRKIPSLQNKHWLPVWL